MRQAIVTKHLGPTNTRGSRVKAIADAGHIVVHWNHRLGVVENHTAAAQALANKLGWLGEWSGGSIPGSGFAFVNADKADTGFFVINGKE